MRGERAGSAGYYREWSAQVMRNLGQQGVAQAFPLGSQNCSPRRLSETCALECEANLHRKRILIAEGRPELAAQVRRFSAQMPPPLTDRESIAEALRRHTREPRTRNDSVAR